MHIAEGFLPAAHCVVWYAASAPFVIHGARAAIRQVREHPENRLLLAAAGAFTFVLSALKMPSVTGSSSHPTGTGVGAVLFRPPVMAFLGTVVLLFQALLLAHGGITTLGANVFSMAIAGPWAGYGSYLLLRRLGSLDVAVFGAAFVADLVTYVVTSGQLAAAYPTPTFGAAVAKFMAVFALTQVPLAIIEGLVSVVLIRVLSSLAGDELTGLGVLARPTSEEPIHA